MRLSVVIVTHNRREALRHTLDRLADNPALPHGRMEVLIVDNGSTDGTAAEARRDDLDVRLIRRERNEGVSARNHAFEVARGEYLLLIDDDSYPLGDAVERSLAYLDEDDQVAAVVGRIILPDGRLEASALPGVVANGALCLRRCVIERVGGLPTDFFRQAEEYDLSFRIWNAGWRIERFEDVCFRHEKVGGNRASSLIHRLDMRNNLILLDRYLPRDLAREYRRDWIQRYSALACRGGHGLAALLGRASARWATLGQLRAPQKMKTEPQSHGGHRERTEREDRWIPPSAVALARRNSALARGNSAPHQRNILCALSVPLWFKFKVLGALCPSPPHPLTPSAIESIFQFNAQERLIAEWSARHNIRRVLIADFSKNIYATWRGCIRAGLEPIAVADNHPAFAGATYRGLPMKTDEAAEHLRFDGIVLSTVSPAQVDCRLEELDARFAEPTLRLWTPRLMSEEHQRPEVGRLHAA